MWVLLLLFSFSLRAQDIDLEKFESELLIPQEESLKPNLDLSSSTNYSTAIKLSDAIEMTFNGNATERARKFEFKLLEIGWKDDFQDFWFPKLSLTAFTGNSLIQKLSTDNSLGDGTPRTPQGYIGLEFSDFALFNWGRDYLTYLNQQTTYNRNKQILSEQRRRLRFSVISNYFYLAMQKNILKIRGFLLQRMSFIFKVARERLNQRKVSYNEVLMIKEEYLNLLSLHRESLQTVKEQHRAFAKVLGDQNEVNYKLLDSLKFITLNIDSNTSKNYALKNNSELLDSMVKLRNAQRSFRKSLRDNMPLPKVSFNLGAYRQVFSQAGVQDTFSTDGSNTNRNVELAASINMNWTLFGRGGLFNSRTNESFYLNQKIAEVELTEVKRGLHVEISTLLKEIEYLEREIDSLNKRKDNSRLGFERSLDLYVSGSINFLNLQRMREAYQESFENYENKIYLHLVKKMEFSETLGLENLPNQNFEKLVIQ